MRKVVTCQILSLFVIIGTADAAERVSGTLNFQNITGTNVNQTVGESSSNEKEVDVGDFDNDDDLDVVIAVAYSDFSQRRNKLYRNDNGVLNEISGAPAIPGFSNTDVTRNAFFRDYDGDGWLDIIVINDNNTTGQAGRTKYYRNDHPGNVFSSFIEEGLTRLGASTGGAACSGVSVDNDDDGDDDLYVGNYPNNSQDTMYFNNGNGFFSSVTGTHVPIDGDYTVDVSSADMNGDGTLDLLISNHSNNELYYNNLNNAGGSMGDYRYTGSEQVLGNASASENAMEPADFDNDGDQDVYWSNFTSTGDRILQNNGNDGGEKALFTMIDILPDSVTNVTSRKATVNDLNQDGRVDVIVGKGSASNSRPTILRNTSVNGDISFVDWTPATAFPNGASHRGWHAAAIDVDGDQWDDILLGGWSNDHLFQNVASDERLEADGSNLGAILNADPIAVSGSAAAGEFDQYGFDSLVAGSYVAVIVNSLCNDTYVELQRANGVVLATLDRGGLGVEEAIQYDVDVLPTNDVRRVVIEMQQIGGDSDGDDLLTLADAADMLNAFGACGGGACAVFDCDGNGAIELPDYQAFAANMNGPSASPGADYVLELLSRN